MDDNSGFMALINAYQQRGQAEAQDFAIKQTLMQQLSDNIGQAAINIGTNIQNDQIQKGQYQYGAETAGVFPKTPQDVMSSPLPSETQQNTIQTKNNLQIQMAMNAGEISNLQKQMNQSTLGNDQLHPNGANNYWSNPKPVLDRLNALIQQNQTLKQTSDALDQHTQTPEYQQQVKSEKWNQFQNQYPVYSDQWNRVMALLNGQGQQTPQQKEDMKLDFENKKNQMELNRYSQEKQVASTTPPPEKSTAIDWNKEKKSVDADPDLMADQNKLDQAHQLINTYAQKTANITDANRLNAIRSQYQSDLAKIRATQTQQPQNKQQTKPQKQTPQDKNQVIINQLLDKYDTGE